MEDKEEDSPSQLASKQSRDKDKEDQKMLVEEHKLQDQIEEVQDFLEKYPSSEKKLSPKTPEDPA